MPVAVAEYLGQRTDLDTPAIEPVSNDTVSACPFMADSCSKVNQGYKPICSVHKKDGKLWITCRHRLCATKKNLPLSIYQVSILKAVASVVYNPEIQLGTIFTKREQSMRVTARSRYKADYIMIMKNENRVDPKKIVLEMQGGGETANTGVLTRHVAAWEKSTNRSNSHLAEFVTKVGTLETNAWRRQQEQFLVKGSIAHQTGGRIVFCMGEPLYDYVIEKVNIAELTDLREYNWNLALICFSEDHSQLKRAGPIPLKIPEEKLIFTNFGTFVNQLSNQGGPDPELFRGSFVSLMGNREVIE